MRVHVITDASGDVVGTLRVDVPAGPGAPGPTRLHPAEGQQVHEIEIPDEFEFESMSVDEFHKEVKQLVGKSR